MASERPETVAEQILERGTFDRELLSSRDTWERLGAGSFGKVNAGPVPHTASGWLFTKRVVCRD